MSRRTYRAEALTYPTSLSLSRYICLQFKEGEHEHVDIRFPLKPMCADSLLVPQPPYEGIVLFERGDLYYREIGQGESIVQLHGGPDFAHTYLLPEMDCLADSFHLIYYDQRGRGKSGVNIQPEDVSIVSEIEDLERLREYFQLETMAISGHSFGGLLAMEYAISYPNRVSHLILLNSAPASHGDYLLFRQEQLKASPEDVKRLAELSVSAGYLDGDPDTLASYYRIHFKIAVRRQEDCEKIVQRLRASFTQEGILKTRAIEKRLMEETLLSNGYDLLPRLREVNIPTLVVHGDHDFVPLECAAHIADTIPGARLIEMSGTGHFSYLESPAEFHKAITDFFQG